jgi:cell division protein FtsW
LNRDYNYPFEGRYKNNSVRDFVIDWWKSIDRVVLIITLCMIIFGSFFIFLNSKYVAIHHNWNKYIFIKKHLLFAFLSIFTMLFLSAMKKEYLVKFLFGLLVISIVVVLFTAFFGLKIKGARRWVSIFGFSLQASEFLKPCIPIFTAYIIQKKNTKLLWVYAIVFGSLLKQPDFGITFILLSSILCQLYVSDFKLKWIGFFILGILLVVLFAYFTIPHVTKRIDVFISSFHTDDRFGTQFQSYKALQTIRGGGFFGKGIGYGIVKKSLPDLHADFIFSGIAEDCGYITCLIIIISYLLIFLRVFMRTFDKSDSTEVLYIVGVCAVFAVQIIINISSNVGIIPPKGTTLPFISYGGSSILSCAVIMGALLNLTRNKRKSLLVTKISTYY